MEANKILQADVLDIIFEGRNKEYGAYNLRKTYNKRLAVALIGMMGLLSILSAGYVVAGSASKTSNPDFIVDSVVLTRVEDKPEVIPPVPVPKPPVQQAATIKFTPPVIMHDNEVPKEEMPPQVNDMEDVKIGAITVDGPKGDDVVAPPVADNGRDILEAPKKLEDDDKKIFAKVEIESQYPGGAGAWMRYLNKTMHYPETAQEAEMQGTVTVMFVVDKEGNVSNVEAISGPATGGLKEEAVRVIRKSGKWEPAIQNGRKVNSYKRQPVIFRLGTE